MEIVYVKRKDRNSSYTILSQGIVVGGRENKPVSVRYDDTVKRAVAGGILEVVKVAEKTKEADIILPKRVSKEDIEKVIKEGDYKTSLKLAKEIQPELKGNVSKNEIESIFTAYLKELEK